MPERNPSETEQRLEAARAEAAEIRRANRAIRERMRDDARLQHETKQAMVADLLRVAEHPDNPFQGFASRKRYRDLGHYPEILVSDFFGNHAEFQRAAGLRDTRTTTKARTKAARLHSAQDVARYAEQHVLPWHDKFPKAAGRRHLECLVGSDWHSWFVDPFALSVFLAACRIVNPDVVVLNGDVFDFPQLSRHRKLPGHFHLNLQQEIEFGREHILRAVREACPDAEILFVIGNHEYRLVTYLADCAPELACLPSMEFAGLLGLDELEISLVTRPSFMAPTTKDRRRELQENWHKVGGCWVVTHGVSCAKFAADKQLDRYQMSGTSGHTHRPQIITGNSLGTGPKSWMSTPMMASYAVGKEYVGEPSMWQMGFGRASIYPEKGLVSQGFVPVFEDWAAFAGHEWRPTVEVFARREEQMAVVA